MVTVATRRPDVELVICPVERTIWPLFGPHHYLSTDLSKAAHCWLATWDERPVAFVGVLSTPGRESVWREHRAVCLPDFQGLGIGSAMSEWVAWLYSADKRYVSTSGHPAVTGHRARSPNWDLVRAPSAHLRNLRDRATGRRLTGSDAMGVGGGLASHSGSNTRATATFRWVGPRAPREEWDAAMRSIRG